MISLFDRQLQRLEHEIRDLKTGHFIGVGTIEFYVKELDIEPTTDLSIELTIAADEPLPPFLMVMFPDGTTFSRYTAPSNRKYTFYEGSSEPFGGKVVAISSSFIEKMEQA